MKLVGRERAETLRRPVPHHEVLRTDQDLTGFSARSAFACLVANDDFDAGRQSADTGIFPTGGIPILGLLGFKQGDRIEHFTLAVGHPNHGAEHLPGARVERRF